MRHRSGTGGSVRIERCMERRGRLMIKANAPNSDRLELAAAIAGLAKLDNATLKAQWRTLYGSAPPVRITRGLLIGAVAYGVQERARGGLAPATRRQLMSGAED